MKRRRVLPARGRALIAIGIALLALAPFLRVEPAKAAPNEFVFAPASLNLAEGAGGFFVHVHADSVPDGAVINIGSGPTGSNPATAGGLVQQPGEDYPFTAATLHCDNGTTMPAPCDKDVFVAIYQDNLAEGNETFAFHLSAPNPNTIILGPDAIFTIVDDEAPLPTTTTTAPPNPPTTQRHKGGKVQFQRPGIATNPPAATPPPPGTPPPGSTPRPSPSPGDDRPAGSTPSGPGARPTGPRGPGSRRTPSPGGTSSRPAPQDTPNGLDAAPPTDATRSPDAGTSVQDEKASPRKASFTRSVADPTEVDFSLDAIARNLILAGGLVLLVVFPAQLFEKTLEENEATILGWFNRFRLVRAERRLSSLRNWLVLVCYAPIAAFFLGFLEPEFGWNAESLHLYIALLIALPALVVSYDLARAWFMKRRYGTRSHLSPQLVALLIAGVLVFASRASHIQPGYMYGALASLSFAGPREPTVAEEARGIAFGSIVLAVVAFAAWFLLIPVNHAARHEEDASGIILTLQATLAILWVGGLGTIAFGLAPLRFFHGEKVKRWKASVWLAMYALAMFVFVELLLRPGAGLYARSEEASATQVTELFIGFGIFSFLFWGFFRLRAARPVAFGDAHTSH